MTTWTDDQRDRFKRPIVDGTAYTRATTFIDALDDKGGLIPWKAGLVALGLTEREDLRRAVINNRDDIKAVRRIAEQAAEHAGSSRAAERGSSLHKMTEEIDSGLEPWAANEVDLADLAVYENLTLGFEHRFIEQAVVNDEYQIGGTPDRISMTPWHEQEVIVDLKTGPADDERVRYKQLAWAAQLAIYANSKIYDPVTGERSENPASKTTGFIVWLPAGQARGRLLRLDLVAGWEAVEVAAKVRGLRKRRDLMAEEFLPTHLPDDLDQLRRLWLDGTPGQRRIIEAKVRLIEGAA
jgi:hypothetical protein